MSRSDASSAPDAELDPELEDWLAQARADERDAGASMDVDALFGEVSRDIEAAERRPTFWLRTRATWVRRLVAWGAALVVVVVGGVIGLRGDFAEYPPAYMAAAVGALGVLLLLSLHQALRPLHRPPRPRWQRGAIVALTLAATFLLALLSPHDPGAEPSRGLAELGSPCLFYGLLMGVPVYLVLRLLDRRSGPTAPLLAACAAGLAGNLVLQLHCPHRAPEHLVLSHFTVALLFVAGLGLAHLLVRRLRG
jgi:hypothetical protein